MEGLEKKAARPGPDLMGRGEKGLRGVARLQYVEKSPGGETGAANIDEEAAVTEPRREVGRSRFNPSHWHLCRWREAAAPTENPLCILERGLSVFTTRTWEKQDTATSRSQAWVGSRSVLFRNYLN